MAAAKARDYVMYDDKDGTLAGELERVLEEAADQPRVFRQPGATGGHSEHPAAARILPRRTRSKAQLQKCYVGNSSAKKYLHKYITTSSFILPQIHISYSMGKATHRRSIRR